MGGQGAEMIVQWAELMDLRPSQAATAPVMIAAKLTPEAQAQAKAFLKDANLQEDMELHGMVSLYEKTYNGLACKVAEVDCKKVRAKLEEMLDEAKDRMEISRENMDRLKAALVRLDESRLYVAVSFVDDTLVGFITTNPEKQVRIASSPRIPCCPVLISPWRMHGSSIRLMGCCSQTKLPSKGLLTWIWPITRACSPG